MLTIFEINNKYHKAVGVGDEGAEKTQDFLDLLPKDVWILLSDETEVWRELATESWQKNQTHPDDNKVIKLILDLYGDREREAQKHFDYSTLPKE